MTSTTTSTAVQVQGGYVVAAGDDLTFEVSGLGEPFVLDAGGATPTLTILGTVHVDFTGATGAGAFAIEQLTADPASYVRIGAGGSLILDGNGAPHVQGLTAGAGLTGVAFENDGLFSIGDTLSATGWTAYPGAGGSFVNTGTFTVSATYDAWGVDGVDMPSITNSGTLTVSGGAGINIPSFGLVLTRVSQGFAGSTITNSGTISVTGPSGSAAIELTGVYPLQATINNSGTITGPMAIHVLYPAGVDLTNTGTINGDLHLAAWTTSSNSPSDRASHIHNSGAIHGDIYFGGADGNLYDGAGGTLSGVLHVGLGSATITLGDDGGTVNAVDTYPYGQSGPVTITGGAGDDTFYASSADAQFDGGGGVNTVSYAGAMSSYGGVVVNRSVTVDLSLAGQAQSTGGAGTQTLSHVQNLIGAGASDVLTGDASDNVIDGGSGIEGDVLDGGSGGEDTVSFASFSPVYPAAGGVAISLASQGVWQTYDAANNRQIELSHFQDVTGSAYNDTIEGDSGDNLLDGGQGVNTVSYAHAGAGVTVSLALQGQAQATVGAGSDRLSDFANLTGSALSDHLTGDAFDNVIDGGDGGTDVLDGAGGTNTLSFASSTSAVTVSLALQNQAQGVSGSQTVTASNFQNLTGSAGDDHLTGDAGDNVIDPGGGHDVLDGGGGTNTLSYASSHAGVAVSLMLQGQAQAVDAQDVDTFTRFQNLTGSAYADTLEGDAGNNVLDGGPQAPGSGGPLLGGAQDTVSYAHAAAAVSVNLALEGRAQDTLGAGIDTLLGFQALVGSAFGDTLEGGGAGATTLTGGLGADAFVYRTGDGQVTIADFSAAQGDVIDLSHMAGFNALGRVLAAASQVGADTVIATEGGSLRLHNTAAADLTAADFVLSVGPSVGPGIGGAPQTGSGVINGGAGDDWLQGQGGNDTLHGGAGSDYLDGGGGVNTAVYDGAYRQYKLSEDRLTVSGGPEGGSDILANIQRIQFADGYLAVSPTDTAGQVFRLYEATLDRFPDADGLANWTRALDGGTSLQSVADGFVQSQEFQGRYGGLDNAGFVTLLYQNVLHRLPDQGGLDNWVGLLNSGQDSRAQVVLGFSESQEDIAALAPAMHLGEWIGDPNAAEVLRLYDTVLGRLPDGAGLADWTHALDTGASLLAVANGFVASAEFQGAYGGLDDPGFVTLLYHNVLGRLPDQAGLDHWVAALAGGESRTQVVLGFSDSPEHITDTTGQVVGGIWVAG